MQKIFKIGLIFSLLTSTIQAAPFSTQAPLEEESKKISIQNKKIPAVYPTVILTSLTAILGSSSAFFLQIACANKNKDDKEAGGFIGGVLGILSIGAGIWAFKKSKPISAILRELKEAQVLNTPVVDLKTQKSH